jgi:protocatechuate 3,4-dioxygenase alpha subunit
MPQNLPYLPQTASQTAGPFVHIGLAPGAAGVKGVAPLGSVIAAPEVPGERIVVDGVILDGTGTPVRDALIEVWQADGQGIHPHPDDHRHAEASHGFRGWGRVVPDFATGEWTLDTIRPGHVPHQGRMQAPHISLLILARGINTGLATRLYFPEDEALLAADPILTLIESPARRATLIARATGPSRYRFVIRLQGEGETVFLDI